MAHQSEGPDISRATRKNVLDWLRVRNVNPSGALDEEAFLDRFVDLDSLPSTDPRFETARYDIRQHRVANYDWDDDWIYSYPSLDLLNGPSSRFADFMKETLHPVVRQDAGAARDLARELSDILRVDGLVLRESGSIGEHPVFHVVDASQEPPAPMERRPRDGTLSSGSGEAHRMWDPGMLRLFISHVSEHKVAVGQLKGHLFRFGIDSFVAHEDIEPTLEWQDEIDEALNSAQALAAILTDDFHDSFWTDHEVGLALARGLLVVPVRAPRLPYGFMARLQALRGDLGDTADLASRMVDVFLSRTETAGIMRAGLATGLERATSFATAKLVASKLQRIQGTSDPVLADRLDSAITSNGQVAEAYGVPAMIRAVTRTLRAPA